MVFSDDDRLDDFFDESLFLFSSCVVDLFFNIGVL